MNPADMFDLLKQQLAYGEIDHEDLPDDVNDLLHLRNLLTELVRVVYRTRDVVDGKAAIIIGPGEVYEYGDKEVSWKHGYSWKATPETELFVQAVVTEDPAAVATLFNMNGIRKTGVEATAKLLNMKPGEAVGKVLTKQWKPEPGLQFKEKK